MLEKEEEDIKKSKEMIKNELENNSEYIEAQEQLRKAMQRRKQIKDRILGNTTYVQLMMDMKETEEEISTLKEVLNTELIELFGKTKSDEFTDANGETRKFKLSAKLYPKGSNKFENINENEKENLR